MTHISKVWIGAVSLGLMAVFVAAGVAVHFSWSAITGRRLGQAQLQKDDCLSAIASFDTAIALNPNNAEAETRSLALETTPTANSHDERSSLTIPKSKTRSRVAEA